MMPIIVIRLLRLVRYTTDNLTSVAIRDSTAIDQARRNSIFLGVVFRLGPHVVSQAAELVN